MLLGRGGATAAGQAQDLLTRAAATYRNLGMESFAAQAARRLDRACDLRRRTASTSSIRLLR